LNLKYIIFCWSQITKSAALYISAVTTQIFALKWSDGEDRSVTPNLINCKVFVFYVCFLLGVVAIFIICYHTPVFTAFTYFKQNSKGCAQLYKYFPLLWFTKSYFCLLICWKAITGLQICFSGHKFSSPCYQSSRGGNFEFHAANAERIWFSSRGSRTNWSECGLSKHIYSERRPRTMIWTW
jgi:hypothetical protein